MVQPTVHCTFRIIYVYFIINPLMYGRFLVQYFKVLWMSMKLSYLSFSVSLSVLFSVFPDLFSYSLSLFIFPLLSYLSLSLSAYLSLSLLRSISTLFGSALQTLSRKIWLRHFTGPISHILWISPSGKAGLRIRVWSFGWIRIFFMSDLDPDPI